MLAKTGGSHINTQILRARSADARLVWIAAIAIPLMLLAPALWNGYPLLQWDTGGYLARWYEGYLVPSRSTVFGLYLHFGEDSAFWINLGIQALATLWILQLTLRVLGMAQPLRLLAISLVLVLATALPWLASMLLTDIFAGLSVLSLFILVAAGERTSTLEKCSLFVFTAFAAATHSATLACCSGCAASAGSCGRCCAGGLPLPDWCRAASPSSPARRCCCRRILRCRGNWPGRRAATASPSGACCRTASSRTICGIIVRSRN